MNGAIRGIAIAAMLLSVVGCSMAESDWNKALTLNTTAAYQSFIEKYPRGEHVDEAKGRILSLQDDQAWQAAQRADTVESFQNYLKIYGGGLHADDARFEITALRRATEWKSMQNDLTAGSLQAFLQKYPDGIESNEARQRLAAIAYRVQLADYRGKAEAMRRRSELQRRFGSVLHDVVVIAPSEPKQTYLVASDPMSESDARATCDSLQREHQHCDVVQITTAQIITADQS
jgi:hypothetical protein